MFAKTSTSKQGVFFFFHTHVMFFLHHRFQYWTPFIAESSHTCFPYTAILASPRPREKWWSNRMLARTCSDPSTNVGSRKGLLHSYSYDLSSSATSHHSLTHVRRPISLGALWEAECIDSVLFLQEFALPQSASHCKGCASRRTKAPPPVQSKHGQPCAWSSN